MKAGHTIYEAVELEGLDRRAMENTINDLELRSYIVDQSMLAKYEKELICRLTSSTGE